MTEYYKYFSKGLKHGPDGVVDTAAFEAFEAACMQTDAVPDIGKKFEDLTPHVVADADRLANPLAAWATGDVGPRHFSDIPMAPPPAITSMSMAAEMTELYWMALLRDLPFADWDQSADIATAAADIDAVLQSAAGEGALERRKGGDFPAAAISAANVFRGTGGGEDVGPFISQFWLHDTPYGTQHVPAAMLVYEYNNALPDGKFTRDYLTNFDEWLHAQNTGKAMNGRAYEMSNRGEDPLYKTRIVRTMRDLASFVHRDALHQAYFNAALQLLAMTNDPVAPVRTSTLDPYNLAKKPDNTPFNKNAYHRMKAFGSFGGPHLLTLVSEVAARSLQLQWFQKWRRHRRLRPEAFAGLAHVQFIGNAGVTRAFGLKDAVRTSQAAQRIEAKTGGLLLPMAYESGSPTHPSYGAGHATVAGACVTVLKAWFHEDDLFVNPRLPPKTDETDGKNLDKYTGAPLTIGGELNKLASNVAMGRSMGGVHYRTDNMRSLAIGEMLATVVLGKALKHFAERQNGQPPKFGFKSFGGANVLVALEGNLSVVHIDGVKDPLRTQLCNDEQTARADLVA